jgi:hypothetical protein
VVLLMFMLSPDFIVVDPLYKFQRAGCCRLWIRPPKRGDSKRRTAVLVSRWLARCTLPIRVEYLSRASFCAMIRHVFCSGRPVPRPYLTRTDRD